MSPSLEFQVQFSAVEPGDILRLTMPGNISEDRVMSSAGVGNLHFTGSNIYISFSPDKMAIDFLRITLLKAPELLGQHAIESICDHGHEDVEVHLHQNGRRQDVKVEELDRLGDDSLNPPSAGVIADNTFCQGCKIR